MKSTSCSKKTTSLASKPPSRVEVEDGVERKAIGCNSDGIDFALLTSRNQLITRAINPMLDMLVNPTKQSHIVDSNTRYSIQIILKSERDLTEVN